MSSYYDADELAAIAKLSPELQAKIFAADVQAGPGIPELENRRVMTGAIDAAEAAEQTTALSGDSDLTKTVNEAGGKVSN